MKSTCKTLALLASGSLAAFAVAGQASAATIGPVSYTLPLTITDFNINAPASLPQFNPALGTLTKVTIDYTGQMQTSGTVTNNSPSSSGTFSTQVQANLGITVGTTPTVTLPSLFFGASSPLTTAPGPGNSFNFAGSDTDAVNGVMFTSAGTLAQFIGTGTVNTNCATGVVQFSGGPGGNAAATNATSAGCGVNITYEYTPVVQGTPEPATLLGLFAVGAAGLASRRRA